jgi:hypothetical protein
MVRLGHQPLRDTSRFLRRLYPNLLEAHRVFTQFGLSSYQFKRQRQIISRASKIQNHQSKIQNGLGY